MLKGSALWLLYKDTWSKQACPLFLPHSGKNKLLAPRRHPSQSAPASPPLHRSSGQAEREQEEETQMHKTNQSNCAR